MPKDKFFKKTAGETEGVAAEGVVKLGVDAIG